MQDIGFGTAAIGRPQYINIKKEKTDAFNLDVFKKNGLKALESAYQQGIRYFDTAPGYGIAEQLLKEWIKEKNDPEIEVATKWGYTYTANFAPNAIEHEVKDHSLGKLDEQWAVSKSLLPSLTTYQIHSATFESGVLENGEVLGKLALLKSQYNILIGLTTSGDNQVDVLKKALDINIGGEDLFSAFQVTYNIFDQSLSELAVGLHATGKRIIVKEALANGRVFPNNNYLHYDSIYKSMQKLAGKYNAGIDAIALRFCIDSIEPFKVLSGATTPVQIQENMKSNDFKLSDSDLEELRNLKVDPKVYWTERKQLNWN